MADRRDGLLCHIAGRGYTVDTELVDWTTVAVGRQSVDQGAAPGETALSNENIWRRSRDDGIEGGGQEYADLLEDESSIFRWRSSEGINPWTRRQFTLLNGTTRTLTSANTNLRLVTATQAGTAYAFLMDGTAIRRSADPTTASSFSALTGGAGTYTSITTDGLRVWVANGTDVYKVDSGTALSSFSTVDCDIVGYANGRLLAAKTNALFELDNTGAMTGGTPLFTHPSSNFVWDAIASSPAGIYAFGHVGDRSEIYVTTAIDSTGALDVPFFAGSLPDGELLNVLDFYLGVVVLGTTRGVRLAQITGGGFLSFGPVISQPGSVLCLEPQGEDVWFGWSNYPATGGNSAALGRVRLSRFTSDLVPAFASDLQSGVSGLTTSVITWAGTKRVFAVGGSGVWSETATPRSTGTLDYGWFTFGIPEAKAADTVSVWTDALPSSSSVAVAVYADDAVVAALSGTDSTAGDKFATYTAAAVTAERFRVTVTLAQTGGTSPVLRRMTLRGVPAPFVSQQMVLPIKLSDTVSDQQGAEYGMDMWAEWQILQGYVASRERVSLTLGSFAATVRLDALQVNPSSPYTARYVDGWDDRRQFLKGTWLVTATTAEPAT